MSKQDITLNFSDGFNGELVVKNGTFNVGGNEGQLLPYDMYLGALGSCFYATFLEIIEKKKITYDSASIRITGEKRKEVPTLLSWVNLDITIINPSTEKGLEKSAELAGKYCSVYQTTSKVADITWNLKIESN